MTSLLSCYSIVCFFFHCKKNFYVFIKVIIQHHFLKMPLVLTVVSKAEGTTPAAETGSGCPAALGCMVRTGEQTSCVGALQHGWNPLTLGFYVI